MEWSGVRVGHSPLCSVKMLEGSARGSLGARGLREARMDAPLPEPRSLACCAPMAPLGTRHPQRRTDPNARLPGPQAAPRSLVRCHTRTDNDATLTHTLSFVTYITDRFCRKQATARSTLLRSTKSNVFLIT